MKVSEHYINNSTGVEFYKINFEIIVQKDVTFEEWHEINHQIEDIYNEIKNNPEKYNYVKPKN
jgi:divalent metal cation (Fe/Co/Zn/Cd) transporter